MERNIVYMYTCAPFGLSVIPWLYTKIMKPVMGHIRAMLFMNVSYLDDCLLIGATFDECKRNIETTISLYNRLGLDINVDKSVLEPRRIVKF